MAREIVMPRLSDSMEEGTILRWLVSAGEAVGEGQGLVEVETDKAVVTYEADAAGTVIALCAAEGATVAVGAPILMLGAEGERAAAPAAGRTASEATATVAERPAVQVAQRDAAHVASPVKVAARVHAAGPARATSAVQVAPRAKASPLARRLAARLGVDLAAVRGTGPQGRVIRVDVERAAASPDRTAGVPVAASAAQDGSKGVTTTVDPTSLQRIVARRMAASRATVPDIELRVEVDMSRLVTLRAELRELAGDGPPSVNDFIVKAVALALREFPNVNGAYREGRFERYERVNVGIAVAADAALIVPTIFDADRRTLSEIAAVSRQLAAQARARQLAPADLDGATFTVSNLGMFGVDSFSAIVNEPQAAILAVGAVRRRPVVLDGGEIVARETAELALACDHRILNGVDGACFIVRVRELLERPLALML